MNRFISKQQKISSRHQEEISKARQAANDSSRNSVDIEFHNSALAQYLTMLLHRADGDMDAAKYDQRMIGDAYRTQPDIYSGFQTPSFVKEELSIPAKKARLNVLAFSGIAPVKYEERSSTQDFVIAYPIMKRNQSSVKWMTVTAINAKTGKSQTIRMEQIESIDNIALDTFKRRSEVIYKKALARMIVKGVTTVASREIGDSLSDSSDSTVATIGLILTVFSAANRLADEAAERADLRTSRYLPARADVAGLTLDPGTYDVNVCFYGDSADAPLAKREFKSVELKPKKLALLEASCLGDTLAAEPAAPTADAPNVAESVAKTVDATDDEAPKEQDFSVKPANAEETKPIPRSKAPQAPDGPVVDQTGVSFGIEGTLMMGGGSSLNDGYINQSYGSLQNTVRLGGGGTLYLKTPARPIGFQLSADILFNEGMTIDDNYTIVTTDYKDTHNLSVSSIDLSALLLWSIPLKRNAISVFGGPVLSRPLAIKSETHDAYFNTDDSKDISPLGINLGLTFGLGFAPRSGKGFAFSARYLFDISPTKGEYDNYEYELYTRRMWLVSAGFQF